MMSQSYIDNCKDKIVQERFLKNNKVNYCFKHNCFLSDGIRKCFKGKQIVSDCTFRNDYGYLPTLDDLWEWAEDIEIVSEKGQFWEGHKIRLCSIVLIKTLAEFVGENFSFNDGSITVHEALLTYILSLLKK